MSFIKTEPYKQNLRPGFVGDYLSREHVLPGGAKLDLSTFPGDDSVQVTTSVAATAGQTTLTVASLLGPIPAKGLIVVTDASVKKYARVTTAAAASSAPVVLQVEALSAAIASGSKGQYVDSSTPKRIHSGTPVFKSNTDNESDASAKAGSKWKNAGGGVAVTDTDVVRIVAYDVTDAKVGEYKDNGEMPDDVDLLRKGTLIRVNHMYWSTLSDTVKAKIRTDYEVTVGTPGQEVPAQ